MFCTHWLTKKSMKSTNVWFTTYFWIIMLVVTLCPQWMSRNAMSCFSPIHNRRNRYWNECDAASRKHQNSQKTSERDTSQRDSHTYHVRFTSHMQIASSWTAPRKEVRLLHQLRLLPWVRRVISLLHGHLQASVANWVHQVHQAEPWLQQSLQQMLQTAHQLLLLTLLLSWVAPCRDHGLYLFRLAPLQGP